MLTVGKGTWGFTYDQAVGEFVLSHPDIKIPDKDGQKIYSFNEGNYQVHHRFTLRSHYIIFCPGYDLCE